MSRRLRPKQITDLDRFEADMDAMHETLIGYCRSLRVDCEHYRQVSTLHANLVATASAVLGGAFPHVQMWTSPNPDAEAQREAN